MWLETEEASASCQHHVEGCKVCRDVPKDMQKDNDSMHIAVEFSMQLTSMCQASGQKGRHTGTQRRSLAQCC